MIETSTGTNKIKAVLPADVILGHKTGSSDRTKSGIKIGDNDAGIIYDTAKGIDLVICFMSQDLNDTAAAQNTIAQDSRAIYGYYNE